MIDIKRYRETASKILSPIKSLDESQVDYRLFFNAQRSVAGRELPEYYFVYFLFSNLLNYYDQGQFEKVAFSFPIEYKSKVFLIEYRKLGLGIFVQNKDKDEIEAREIAKRISGAVKSIRPYYDHLAEQAVKDSKINVVNRSLELFERFDYLLKAYEVQINKSAKFKGQRKTVYRKGRHGEYTSNVPLDFKYNKQAKWLAISSIEAFFSWTEHLFIHLAIVGQSLHDGEEIAKLIEAEWKIKYRAAIPFVNAEAKNYYDELTFVRQQLRNFVAHGAFGKDGNAFHFHSDVGAVPVVMSHNKKINKFSFYGQLQFNDQKVIQLIQNFIKFLWESSTKPAMYYIQKYSLPTIVPYAKNGIYAIAVTSTREMKKFAENMQQEIDNAHNMDW